MKNKVASIWNVIVITIGIVFLVITLPFEANDEEEEL